MAPTDELGRTFDLQTYTFPSSEPDSTPPSVPANVQAQSPQRGQVTLQWAASTDNVGVTGYLVYRNGALLTTLTGTGTTYTDNTADASITIELTAGNTAFPPARYLVEHQGRLVGAWGTAATSR